MRSAAATSGSCRSTSIRLNVKCTRSRSVLRAIDATRLDMEQSGRTGHFTLFARYDLDPAEGVRYAALAHEFSLTESQVTNALALVRRTFRTHALTALRGICGTEEEFRREARELFGLEVE